MSEGTFELTAQDVFEEKPTKVELNSIKKGNKKAVVYIVQPTSWDVLCFTSIKESKRNEAILDLIIKYVVDSKGTPIFNESQAKQIPAKLFTELSTAVTSAITLDTNQGNALGATPPSGSLTN